MYVYPIEVVLKETYSQFEDDVCRMVQEYGVNVNKDELMKALQNDRNKYDKGYCDGVIEFAKYLKEHSSLYGLNNYIRLDAINIDYLYDFVEDFLEENIGGK